MFYNVVNNAGALITTPHVIGDGRLYINPINIFGSGGFPLRVSCTRQSDMAKVIYAIGSSGSTYLNITSAIEGTTDIDLGVNDVCTANVTAGSFKDIHDTFNLIGSSGLITPLIQGGTTAAAPLRLSSTSHSTKGRIEFGANAYYDEATGDTNFPGTAANSVRIGPGATATLNATAMGVGAGATNGGTSFGRSASAAQDCVAIGYGTVANSLNGIALGRLSNSAHNYACVIGTSITSSRVNEFRYGSTGAATTPILALSGTSSTTTNLNIFDIQTEWVDSTHATRKSRAKLGTYDFGGFREGLRLESDGTQSLVSIGGGVVAAGTTLTITPQAAITKGLVIKGFTSQSANLQEWQGSAGTVLASINSAGLLDLYPLSTGGANTTPCALTITTDGVDIGATSVLFRIKSGTNPNANTVEITKGGALSLAGGINSGTNAIVGAPSGRLNGSTICLASNGVMGFSSGTNAGVPPDAGIARDSAGTLKVTNGSTGPGSLVVGLASIDASGGITPGNLTVLPTASVTHRGKIYTVFGSSGVADHAYICLKDVGDVYQWVEIG